MLTVYETPFITSLSLDEEGLQKILGEVEKIVVKGGGEVLLTEDWGRKQLFYRIKKEVQGRYSYLVYTAQEETLREIREYLGIHEKVLRERIFKIARKDRFDVPQFRKKRLEMQFALKEREKEKLSMKGKRDESAHL